MVNRIYRFLISVLWNAEVVLALILPGMSLGVGWTNWTLYMISCPVASIWLVRGMLTKLCSVLLGIVREVYLSGQPQICIQDCFVLSFWKYAYSEKLAISVQQTKALPGRVSKKFCFVLFLVLIGLQTQINGIRITFVCCLIYFYLNKLESLENNHFFGSPSPTRQQ